MKKPIMTLVLLLLSLTIQAQEITGSVTLNGKTINYTFSEDSILIDTDYDPILKVNLNGIEQKLDTAIFEYKVDLDEIQYVIFHDDYDSLGVLNKKRFIFKFDREEPY